ncbi:hypothetical protein WMY93_005223 [Mugilogobius chulae]|uniref:Uncharacterized protein n=1 Tax=Mugilogobius chulae TaxID=88201 RepID=A0AAW0PQW2_9GOBI
MLFHRFIKRRPKKTVASSGFLTEASLHEQVSDEKGSPVFRLRRGSGSENEQRPQSQQSDPTELQTRVAKVRLSPVQPTRPLPSVEKNFTSFALRAANRIDRDCLDYMGQAKRNERLHRNLSDSRLLETMGSDSASVNSMNPTTVCLAPSSQKMFGIEVFWKAVCLEMVPFLEQKS